MIRPFTRRLVVIRYIRITTYNSMCDKRMVISGGYDDVGCYHLSEFLDRGYCTLQNCIFLFDTQYHYTAQCYAYSIPTNRIWI